MKNLMLFVGLLLLFATEILRVYFIMPFPGSQMSNTLGLAYFIHQYVWIFRVAGILLLLSPLLQIFRKGKMWKRVMLSFILVLYAFVFYLFNFRFMADKMFYQPRNKNYATGSANKVPANNLVIGVQINGEAKAYPIEIIGYHHQVQDTIGGEPVMITYCTVCRTGRAFSPFVNGHKELFRLVGMDHFNAMFEDKTTGSWWRQATGEAVAGPLKGKMLKEISSAQMTLNSWLHRYPSSTVLQPDAFFKKQYEDLAGFDKGTINSSLERRDTASGKFKSWVVGVTNGKTGRAYDWNDLLKKKIIQDSLPDLPLVVVVEKDSSSFHAWNRKIDNHVLQFTTDSSGLLLKDAGTNSSWNMDGVCVEGPLTGKKLQPVQASQEFWHSWQTFHSLTTMYMRK